MNELKLGKTSSATKVANHGRPWWKNLQNYNFNFLAQNSPGLTSVYSKEPANLWKEALSETHGKPRLFANEVKTNVDTFWQLNMKLTVLIPLICLSRYTKIIQIQTRSKLLVQGSDMFILYTDMQIWLPM